VRSKDVNLIKKASTQENFEELCEKIENDKTPTEELLSFEKNDLESEEVKEIIELLHITDSVLNNLLNDAYTKEAYSCMKAVIVKINKKITSEAYLGSLCSANKSKKNRQKKTVVTFFLFFLTQKEKRIESFSKTRNVKDKIFYFFLIKFSISCDNFGKSSLRHTAPLSVII